MARSERPQDDVEILEWLSSIDDVLKLHGPEYVQKLMGRLSVHIHQAGVRLPFSARTPYINTIHASAESAYPGDVEIERRIRSITRWNAMAMVVRANRVSDGIGGHISTYASAATLYETGFNYFFRARNERQDGDIVYFQGHASPGIYARAFLEGRISLKQLENFRRELKPGGGLSSYPHPWLMPNFWEFPTVSMGLSPLMAIYQARFNRFLEDRGLKAPSDRKVWAFLGDGETDEPETLGAISLAAREKLDNLIFVINCNLQRLDGPVRGNGQIIQELEANFRGSGWNVIKVLWGRDWDPLFDKDDENLLVRRLNDVVDGQMQKFNVATGKYIREHLFGADPKLLKMVEGYSDEKIRRLNRGGHDIKKVYTAYKAAVENKGTPTVILAHTIKGYGLGEAGEGKNITHQQKKLNEDELREFRTRFAIPISDEEVAQAPFYKPPENSPEMKYLRERRAALGGYMPKRSAKKIPFQMPEASLWDEFSKGTDGRVVSTTMVFVRVLSKLLKDAELGPKIVPIVPDEARTFGMEAFFRQCGIYSHVGQLYEPVDMENLIYYREAKDGQILEEGITEAGSMASFVAAGTSYSTSGVNTIPFFIYYSMFGFQRIGDFVWAAGDMRTRGFMLGATAGRTTLAGEGLQHQDGHSHVLALPVPNLVAYDPAFAFELAVIIREGIRRMYENHEDVFYYITLGNEAYAMPPMPAGVEDGILRGMYLFKRSTAKHSLRAQLFGSGAIMNEALKAQELLESKFGVSADVWSITSYKELRREALDAERFNRLNPDQPARQTYIEKTLKGVDGVFVAASDYMKVLPDSVAKWFPKPLMTLGTEGYGRSETRESLRDFFEVDAKHIALATMVALMRDGKVSAADVAKARAQLGIDPKKLDPMTA
jgi:pyruvate dehydrogenase E1 component